MDKSTEKFIRKSMEDMQMSTLPVFTQKFFSCLELDREDGLRIFLNVLKEKTTHKDRVVYIHQSLDHLNLLLDKYKEDHKDDRAALKYKQKADKFFAMGKYCKALRSYTKSLMRAKDQQLLATAYANRSATLLKLELYKECLTDIERAFINNYPENLKPNIIDRRRKATELMPESKKEKRRCYEEVPTIPIKLRNPKNPSASSSVQIQKCRTGQKVVATETIQVGDVIIVEEPPTATINEVYLYHCHECFELCYNPIPCDGCTQTLYCRETCKRKAFRNYHQYECPILKSMAKLVDNTSLLTIAVKICLQIGEQQLSDEISQLIQSTREEKFFNQMDLEVTAAVMYELVKEHTKRFDGPNGEATESSFKNNILPLLQVCFVKASGVVELCPFNDDSKVFKAPEIVATAIYPLYAKFRHSCAPNAFPHYYGLKKVLRAVRTINKGEEVLVSFGPHYGENFRRERQDLLYMQYHFRCTCRACIENWNLVALKSSHMALGDFNFLCAMKIKPDLIVAKRTIPEKIQRIKDLEGSEPNCDLMLQQRILCYCYNVLGNKRLIR